MSIDDLSLKLASIMRRSGLDKVPRAVLAGILLIGLALMLIALWQFWPRARADFAVSKPVSSSTQGAIAERSSPSSEAEEIMVDVEGCVNSPGLYALEPGARIGDAIQVAGGLSEDAAPGSMNLAQKLMDGDQVLVPSIVDIQARESSSSARDASIAPRSAADKININTASAQELQQLSGVGPSLSERIIDYRQANGRFSTIEDLKKVSGIGDAKYASIKDKICV